VYPPRWALRRDALVGNRLCHVPAAHVDRIRASAAGIGSHGLLDSQRWYRPVLLRPGMDSAGRLQDRRGGMLSPGLERGRLPSRVERHLHCLPGQGCLLRVGTKLPTVSDPNHHHGDHPVLRKVICARRQSVEHEAVDCRILMSNRAVPEGRQRGGDHAAASCAAPLARLWQAFWLACLA
jgi:hypothetical protein